MSSPRRQCPRFRLPACAPLGLALVLLAGCQRDEIAVYDAPKDAPPPAAAMPPGHGASGGGMMADQMPPRPGLAWKKLPNGWSSRGPTGMRVANFTVPGPDNSQADLAVIPLPGTGGGDLDLVNLWRSQLSLEPITEAQLKSHTDETEVAGQTIRLFSIVGADAADAKAGANQILVAALRREGFTWFFKLAGGAGAVAANREPLKAFLGDVEFTAPAPAPAAAETAAAAPPMRGPFAGGGGGGGAMAAPSGAQPTPGWQVPSAWKSVQAPQMVHSKWSVDGTQGHADVTVSVFPGDVGGLVPNLNRWRAQVGLSPAPEADLQALADNTDVLGGKATLADFTGSSPESGQGVRLIGAVVRRDGWSWFYKIIGSPAAVEGQRETFVKFLQTATYNRAP